VFQNYRCRGSESGRLPWPSRWSQEQPEAVWKAAGSRVGGYAGGGQIKPAASRSRAKKVAFYTMMLPARRGLDTTVRSIERGGTMGILDGKVAIVTGGTSGIGERIVEVFVGEGAHVVVAARRADEGAALEKRLGISFVKTDVTIETDVQSMIDHAATRYGRIDCLINNAGSGSPVVSITEVDITSFDQVMAVNVRGVFLGIKHVAPVMISQHAGSIVNISSMGGLRGGVSGHAYTAAKGAVHALTRSAAAELGEHGVRVNSISPGGIVTGIFNKTAGLDGAKADRVADVAKELLASLQPLPRAGVTDDVAQGCLYLASDGGSFVNGHDLVIDGGHTATTWGWSDLISFRANMVDRIKDAAAKL